MRTEIAKLQRTFAVTMIYVTHDQIEAMTPGQRIVVLDAGVIRQTDTPMHLYEKPANVRRRQGSGPARLHRTDWQRGVPQPALRGSRSRRAFAAATAARARQPGTDELLADAAQLLRRHVGFAAPERAQRVACSWCPAATTAGGRSGMTPRSSG
jgi:ABC-type Fe3+/spermidine/putrescine transport system ATPase subunit